MLLKNILSCTPTTFSFEFFPPKTDTAWEHLFHTIADLMPLSPSWVSVTYGAGGTTREKTHRLVVRLNNQTDLTVVSHLTCVASTREDIHAILDHYEPTASITSSRYGEIPPRDRHGGRRPPADSAMHPTWSPSSRTIFPACASGLPVSLRATRRPRTDSGRSTISRPRSMQGRTSSSRSSLRQPGFL